jgi:2-succinyl-6-hydroxy-2,4-cyclohexadiene-1-carboxylate synthase
MAPLAATRAGDGATVVLVHGFTQTAASMAPLGAALGARRVVAVDLPGHGGSRDVRADLDETARLVTEAAGDDGFDVVGYSLGGRVALHVACQRPDGLRRTVAISASPGIADPEARQRRLVRDAALADALEAEGDVAGFLTRWLANPLFATLPPSRAGVEDRAANSAAGLADSLRRCSLGTQRDLAAELTALDRPVLFVTGARDDPFTGVAARLASASRAIGVAVVPGAGHVVHLERPAQAARMIRAFLDAPNAGAPRSDEG